MSQPWTCALCGDTTEDFTRLQDHLRLLHPDADRQVVDVDGQVRVTVERSATDALPSMS